MMPARVASPFCVKLDGPGTTPTAAMTPFIAIGYPGMKA
jgi:hypothetical protein